MHGAPDPSMDGNMREKQERRSPASDPTRSEYMNVFAARPASCTVTAVRCHVITSGRDSLATKMYYIRSDARNTSRAIQGPPSIL